MSKAEITTERMPVHFITFKDPILSSFRPMFILTSLNFSAIHRDLDECLIGGIKPVCL